MKIASKKYLRNKCDKLVGAKCRKLGKCEICGAITETIQWIHFLTRAIIKLRYDPRNYACACAKCHFKAHANPKWFVVQWERIRGKQTPMILSRESNNLKPLTVQFYLDVLNGV